MWWSKIVLNATKLEGKQCYIYCTKKTFEFETKWIHNDCRTEIGTLFGISQSNVSVGYVSCVFMLLFFEKVLLQMLQFNNSAALLSCPFGDSFSFDSFSFVGLDGDDGLGGCCDSLLFIGG